MFHAHIPKLIRTIEPHLRIAQKKQLKKEGKYKGQQEEYPRGLDEKAKPDCASYVRQLVVGVSDPGKKHKYIVERYVEEFLKNIENLEILETRVFTESIGQSIGELKHLKALRLFSSGVDPEYLKPLFKVKGLKHLDIQGDCDFGRFSGNVEDYRTPTQSLIRNSMSTLLSLTVVAHNYSGHILKDWDTKATGKHDFTALKSLTLSGVDIDAGIVMKLEKAFDFMRLRELSLGNMPDENDHLFKHLTILATSSERKSPGISLRKLSLKMGGTEYSYMHSPANFESKCAFISSFSTLTTLELPDYGMYPVANTINPGLSDMLLQAILKHKGLKTFKMSYAGIPVDKKVPYLSPETVGQIVDGLPLLQEFEFPPDEEKIVSYFPQKILFSANFQNSNFQISNFQQDQISAALTRGENLTAITCFPYQSWGSFPAPDSPGENIITSILKAFVSNVQPANNETFVWEEHCKLRRVSVTWKQWEVASKLGKAEKGMGKTQSVKSDDGREVLYRDVSAYYQIRRIHVGYDLAHEWVEKVERDM